MMNNRYFLKLMFCAVICHSCGSESDSELSGRMSTNSGELSNLGMGYDITKAEVTGNQCFNFFDPNGPVKVLDEKKLGQQAVADLKFERNMNFAKLNQLLSGSLGLSIPVYPGISAKGSVSLASHFSSQKYTETIVLDFKADLGGSKIFFDDLMSPDHAGKYLSPRLEEIKKKIAVNPQQMTQAESERVRKIFEDMCGDEYISYIRKGLSLIAILKFEFKNEYDRKAFAGSLGVNLYNIIDADVSLGFENINSQSQGTVSLYVQQNGGDPTILLDILGNEEDSTESKENHGLLECSMGDKVGIKPCLNAFKKVIHTAWGIKLGIEADGEGHQYLERAVPILIETSPYPQLGELAQIKTPGEINLDYAENIAKTRKRYASRMDVARKNLQNYLGVTIATIRRIDSITKKFGVIKPKNAQETEVDNERPTVSEQQTEQELESLLKLKAKMELARIAITDVESTCNSEGKDVIESFVAKCEAEVNLIVSDFEHGRFKIDTGLLSPEPKNIRSWCLLSHIPGVLNINDVNTVIALMHQAKAEISPLPKVSDGLEVQKKVIEKIYFNCSKVENYFAENNRNRRFLELDLSREFNENKVISSLRPLNSFPKLNKLVVKNQFINSLTGIKDLMNLVELDFTNNKFTDIFEFSELKGDQLKILKLGANYIQNIDSKKPILFEEIDLSDNVIENIYQLQVPNVRRLNLANNVYLESIDGLKIANGQAVVLDLRGTDMTCPQIFSLQCL